MGEMEKKRNERTGYVDADTLPTLRQARTAHIVSDTRRPSLLVIGAVVSMLTLIATVALMVSNYWLYIESMSILLQILVWAITVGVPVVGIVVCVKLVANGTFWSWGQIENRLDQRAERRRLNAISQAETARITAEADALQAASMQTLRTISFDQNGNAAMIGVDSTQITQLAGQMAQPVAKSNAGLLGVGSTQPVAQYSSPSQDQLLGALVPNSLTVSPGIRNSNGQPVIVSITEIPHLKIIGSSGFGKSCLAAALLDQACQLNSPDKLQIALLDLEHKTSRLFEDRANIAEINLGTRRVTMVATDADEVAQHLGFLKRELSRRTKLSEDDLLKEPVLLMYVEEMLSLQFEVEEELLQQMLADITILAIRGRKYGMFLLAVSQTDYSTQELRIAQKQFRFRAAAGIDTTAARAAGFMNTELIKNNFQHGKPGQFVVEYPSFSDLVLAPDYDVKKLVLARAAVIRDRDTSPILRVVNDVRNPSEQTENKVNEHALQAKREQVMTLRDQNWGKINIIEKVWNVKRGGSQGYIKACAEYDAIVGNLDIENSVNE
jgi:hypothetical protein